MGGEVEGTNKLEGFTNMTRTTTEQRRAAKRIFSWYLAVFEVNGHSYKTPSMYSDCEPENWKQAVLLDDNVRMARLFKSGKQVCEVKQ